MDNAEPADAATDVSAILLLLKSEEARISKLENQPKSIFKQVTENGSVAALFLGLVLTLSSLYDAFFVKPGVAHITAISQFDQAVNAAAKTLQDLTQAQLQATDPQVKLAMQSMATPQMLNDLATARAIRRELKPEDIGIPQLLILIEGAFATQDWDSAGEFIAAATARDKDTPSLQSQAKRYQGKYFYLTGKLEDARSAYRDADKLLGTAPLLAAQRAYTLSEFFLFEFGIGDCNTANSYLSELGASLRAQGVSPDNRLQLAGMIRAQVAQTRHCPAPGDLEVTLGS